MQHEILKEYLQKNGDTMLEENVEIKDIGKDAITATKKRGLTGSALKWIAIVTMFIDHLGLIVVYRGLYEKGLIYLFPIQCSQEELYHAFYIVYEVMRKIGRLAFPIFCFLLVEGFLHTHDAKKYGIRLLLFALISEIPFNYAMGGEFFGTDLQNVMFTLFIGFCVMAAIRRFTREFATVKSGILVILIVAAGCTLAYLLKTDYDFRGILCIAVIYLFRHGKIMQSVAGALSFAWELPAPLSFLFTYFYNGERGKQNKYFFYIFYPAHLLLLRLLVTVGEKLLYRGFVF